MSRDVTPPTLPLRHDRSTDLTAPQSLGAKRGSCGGRPVSYDAQDYKQRNVIERAINRLKQWRGIATRYEKRAANYLGMLTLAAILLWL